jgi:hypothetical protein
VSHPTSSPNHGPAGDMTGTRHKGRIITVSHHFNGGRDDPKPETSLTEEQTATAPSQGLTGAFRFQIWSYSPLETQIIETTRGNKTSQSQQGRIPLNPTTEGITNYKGPPKTRRKLTRCHRSCRSGHVPCVYSAVTATGEGPFDEVDLWPITLGPSPGWRIPSAAPNILFPGSPILGGLPTLSKPSPAGPPMARMAGSEGGPSSMLGEPNVDEMSELSVG